MSGDLDDRLDEHGRRISNLEGDVSSLKIDVSKIGLVLNHHAEKAEERHGMLSTQQIKMMEVLNQRDREAREYRARREEREEKEAADHAKWLRSLVNPQTVVIILAIILSLFGTRMAYVQQVAEIIGSPIPQKALPAQPLQPLQPLPAQPVGAPLPTHQ